MVSEGSWSARWWVRVQMTCSVLIGVDMGGKWYSRYIISYTRNNMIFVDHIPSEYWFEMEQTQLILFSETNWNKVDTGQNGNTLLLIFLQCVIKDRQLDFTFLNDLHTTMKSVVSSLYRSHIKGAIPNFHISPRLFLSSKTSLPPQMRTWKVWNMWSVSNRIYNK